MKAYANQSRSKTSMSRKKAESIAGAVQTDQNQADTGNQAVLKMLEVAESFNPKRGTELNLPEELKNRMENYFGVSLSGLQLRESSQVSSLGAKAVTRGETVSFAPGVFDPATRTGRDIIGHEVAHVVQQATGRVAADIAGTNISLDQGLEHAADHEGSMAVMDTGSLMEGQQPLAVLPAVTAANAPMQGKGWGLGGMWRRMKKFFGRGKEETTTRAGTDAVSGDAAPAPASVLEAIPSEAPVPVHELPAEAAPVPAAETATASTGRARSNAVSLSREKSVGLPTNTNVRRIAGQYITATDTEFENILNLLDQFHHTIDMVRLPSVSTQASERDGYLQQLGQANAQVMTAYDNVLASLMAYSEAHRNDPDQMKQTLAIYAIQYYMTGDAEKIRTQSIYDAMQRAVSAESPTGGQADFNELAGKTYREAINAMGVFVNRQEAIKKMSGGMNTVDFIPTGNDQVGVLKKGQAAASASKEEYAALLFLQDIIDDEVEMSRIRAQSFEELSLERGYEFARAVMKYRNISSRKQINDVIASLETTEQVYRERLSKETNNIDDLKDRSFDIKDANTSQRDVAVSRINKLLGFDIITETEFAQTEDRTKSSLAKKAEGEQAGRFLYYTKAQDKGDMEVQAIIQAIYDYLDSKQRIAGNYGLKPEEKEKEIAALGVTPVQSINIGKSENALQLIKLTIIDMIVGHVDRHAGNFMVQAGKDDSMTLKGIDNDTAFGLFDNITGEEGEEKADAYRITPFISDSLPFVPLSIYEKVKKIDSSMIRGALTGLLSEAEIHFTENRFEKVKAHLEKLVSAHKVQDPTEQNVTELAGRNREGYDQNNYIGTLISKTAQSREQIEKSMKIGIYKEKGYTSMEDLTKDITLLRENGIDPLELVRTKKDFSKVIVAEALSAKTG